MGRVVRFPSMLVRSSLLGTLLAMAACGPAGTSNTSPTSATTPSPVATVTADPTLQITTQDPQTSAVTPAASQATYDFDLQYQDANGVVSDSSFATREQMTNANIITFA